MTLTTQTEASQAAPSQTESSQTSSPTTSSTIYVDAKKRHEVHLLEQTNSETLQDPEQDQEMEGQSGDRGAANAERHHEGNVVKEAAQQLNGNLGPTPKGAKHVNGNWEKNQAHGEGQQINGDDNTGNFFRKNVGSQLQGVQNATK